MLPREDNEYQRSWAPKVESGVEEAEKLKKSQDKREKGNERVGW